MQPFFGGMVIAIGFAWILMWLGYALFVKAGISSLGSAGFRPRKSPTDEAELDARGKKSYRRTAAFMRRGVPVALLVVIAGIVIAITRSDLLQRGVSQSWMQ